MMNFIHIKVDLWQNFNKKNIPLSMFGKRRKYHQESKQYIPPSV